MGRRGLQEVGRGLEQQSRCLLFGVLLPFGSEDHGAASLDDRPEEALLLLLLLCLHSDHCFDFVATGLCAVDETPVWARIIVGFRLHSIAQQ